jgi:hypothetical protein
MNERYRTLVSKLSHNLAPVRPPVNVNQLAVAWFVLSAIYVIAITHVFGPVRPNAVSQLATEPRFLLETLLGVAAILWISMIVFRSSVPAALNKPFAVTGFVLLMLWLAQYVIGLADPALPPSTLGARPHCWLETMAYALPVILAGLYFVRRFYPLRPVRTAMSIGLVAGMLPALYMQIACKYDPAHALLLHILPGLLMVGVGAGIAALWSPRRSRSVRN